jgi:YidC/Oxa1 family membrane protein insertase
VFQLSRFSGTWPDGTNKTRAVQGVRAEKWLGTNLHLVKEFEVTSTYLVNVRTKFENRSQQTLALPAQQWVVGAATPLNPQDDETALGFHWWNGSKFQQASQAQFSKGGFACIPGTPLSEFRPEETNVVWATVHNQFFVLALIPQTPATGLHATKSELPSPSKEEMAADSRTRAHQFAFEVTVTQGPTNLLANQTLERAFTIFAGPREYRILERIGSDLKNELERVMDFGFFGFFSKMLLLSMNGLNALGLSYGMAIIAITVIIKLLFWPLTQASTRSMKRMQALQPQMKAIQEKFKDDPVKMNKKVMEFMKEHKVSPLGGCLPLLLQIPVFIGFFQMVRSAIELRGARFLWACDLSKPDTVLIIPGLGFNVNPLPLLMGVTMFWQARLTPPSPGMDPMQQKIMKYMPMIFLVILYNYSAGLTLYWTVQNLLSIAQMKLTKATEGKAVVPARPTPVAPPPKKKK